MQLAVLGSTGSIGQQTLDVVRHHPDKFSVLALTAHKNIDLLFKQCQEFNPEYIVCVDEQAAASLREWVNEVGVEVDVLSGAAALVEIAALPDVDCVVAAIVGAAGLASCFAAAEAGKRLLLANKEALVMSGSIFMQAVRDNNALLLPVDSEHNALFQCMPVDYLPGDGRPAGVERLVLTASGGPFRERDPNTLGTVTPQQAVAHPNWSMGAKISVDSATMMNKGLEVIEAHYLFGMPAERLEVIVHPQSIIHSLLHMIDGSVLAQMGMPDMRCPIAHCLAWPQRVKTTVERLDLVKIASLSFEAPELTRFPCLQLAYQALEAGPAEICALNAANEVAVGEFLNERIGYLDIPRTVDFVLNKLTVAAPRNVGDVFEIDQSARELAKKYLLTYKE